MKIQLLSDLHIDTYPPGKDNYVIDLHPQAEVLVVLGDVVEYNLEYLDGVFDYVNIPVLYVPGNHEYVNGDVDQVVPRLKEYFEHTNVKVLHRESILINEVLFVGATLWSPLDSEKCILDPQWANSGVAWHRCKGLGSGRWQEEFNKDYEFIKSTLSDPEIFCKRAVVLTHFMPLMNCIPERFKNSSNNEFFASDKCMDLFYWKDAPDWWMHGHTHDSINGGEYATRIMCNPRGSYRSNGVENPNFNPRLLIDLDDRYSAESRAL